MQTILIELKNQKACRLLKELEDLQLIRLVKTSSKLSDLRKQVEIPMSETEIDKHVADLRNEWHRDI